MEGITLAEVLEAAAGSSTDWRRATGDGYDMIDGHDDD